MKRLKLSLMAFLGILMMQLTFVSSALAQDSLKVVYRVNNAVVTEYDVEMIRRIYRIAYKTEFTPAQAKEQALNNELISQAVTRFDIETPDSVVGDALASIAGGEGKGATLRQQLVAGGVPDSEINKFFKTQVVWRSYVQSRFAEQIPISDKEINQGINSIPDQVSYTVTIAEIALPFAEYGGAIPTRFEYAKIRDQLNAGTSFSSIARRVSRSVTAQRGGIIGEIPVEALNGQLGNAVRNLPAGRFTRLETANGIIILKVVSRNERRQSLPRTETVSYVELFLKNRRDGRANTVIAAQALEKTVRYCSEAQTKTALFGGHSKFVEATPKTSLDSDVYLALSRIQPNDRTLLYRNDGVSVLYLCANKVVVPEEVAEPINAKASSEAIDKRAQGLVLELRRNAIIVEE